MEKDKMKSQLPRFCVWLGLIFLISGCASYYKVVNPASNKAYYTDKIERKDNGVIQFKDDATKAQVTLPSSEVTEVTKDEYKANMVSK